MLEKTYRPEAVEQEIYERWQALNAFAADPDSAAMPWAVMMPPPNVTGSLHMGHALNTTLQDILTRYFRMRGRDALWQPGMDHAGIATQMVVERQLADEKIDRREMGRDAFVARVWQWKEQSGGTINRQLLRLGASPDWARERFTLDDGLSRAVRTVFVQLHRDGLIYRDKRLVNWDCQLLTAISDLEVDQREVAGHLWYIRYPIDGDDERHITVATTRPETMLGDTAVAVHPEDDRFKDLIGRHAILPLVGRRIPIIGDAYSDPDKGTGAVKITPAHDFNDFEVGRRHDLEQINVLDAHGKINEAVPAAYQRLDRYVARERIVADLDAAGLLERVEDHVHTVPYGDRSHTIIEPWLTDQWYVNAETLAAPAIEAVEQGHTKFVPRHWENTYFEWMRNIQPWCISRQLWWGHRIPAWYGPDGHVFVAIDADGAHSQAKAHYGKTVELTQDEDVLDTWFSSALWPFSTLGWPEPTPELARYYPGDVLLTGFDIIFFWVARMMMMGLYVMKDVPFRDVYIHALIRDEQGQKMSKSKGNIIDPLDLMEKYGTDALRFTLAAMAAQGRDIKLSEQRVAGYRNFATKLWNAARFCQMNQCAVDPKFDPSGCQSTINRWVVGAMIETTREAETAIESYRFNEAAGGLYHFIWGTFCDWYLEFSKPVLYGDDEAAKAETRACAGWVLEQILRTLHPFMPFITEELFASLADRDQALLMSAVWPTFDGLDPDQAARDEVDWVVRLITEIRSVRAEMNVPPSAKIPLQLKGADDRSLGRLATHETLITTLARLETTGALEGDVPEGAVQLILDEATLVLPLADVIDVAAEKSRLTREIDKMSREIAKLDKKLQNQDFLARAPAHVVDTQRERLVDAEQSRERLEDAMARLGG